MTLLAVSDLRKLAGVGLPSDAEQLNALMSAAESQWEELTGRPWETMTGDVVVLRMDNDRRTKLWLPRTPVTAVTKIETRSAFTQTYSDLASTSWMLVDGTTGCIERTDGAFWSEYAKVTYNGGYAQNAVPNDVRLAIAVQVRFMHVRLAPERLVLRGGIGRGGTVDMLERSDFHPLFLSTARTRRRLYG